MPQLQIASLLRPGTQERWRRLYYELQQMQTQGFGSIVNLDSGAGLVGVPGFSGYTAAKHGVVRFTKTAALDYGPDGIRVNAIAAGLVDTPLVATGRSPEIMAARIAAHPIGRIAQASEIADAVVWLCSTSQASSQESRCPWTAATRRDDVRQKVELSRESSDSVLKIRQ